MKKEKKVVTLRKILGDTIASYDDRSIPKPGRIEAEQLPMAEPLAAVLRASIALDRPLELFLLRGECMNPNALVNLGVPIEILVKTHKGEFLFRLEDLLSCSAA